MYDRFYRHVATKDRPWVEVLKALLIIAVFFTVMISLISGVSKAENRLDPMEDRYSLEIREEYAACRKETDPFSRFFCNCRVLEKQCEAPRKFQHGDWNTVEFWPSDDPSEREVQFILFLSYDILGDFTPVDKGIVMSCVAGVSELNVFVGNEINPNEPPVIEIDNSSFEAQFTETDDDYVIEFSNNVDVYDAILKGNTLTVSYENSGGDSKDLEFDTFGFDEVTKGWEKICFGIKS